ncbi:myb dna [Fusarium longipes]|uniref:Myb dna n=1 Tax=Fusarium longipes TaxID=694270 RepID=A0A395SKR3_9HYPO|nr:myb dna [Fusarium longipes]
MSSNGTGSSKWPDFRLASTIWSLMPGSTPNRPDKQNKNNDAVDHDHEDEQQHESEHQDELHKERNQSPKLVHQDMDTEDRPIDGIGGLDSYEDVQDGSEDGGQDQDFGVLEMFDSNATQAPYSSQINDASLNQKAPEAFMTEEPTSTQTRKHKREKKERKRKGSDDSASPQLTNEEDSSHKHRKSKKKSAQPVEIPDSLADNTSAHAYQTLPQQISAVDLDDDGAAPATQTKRKRKSADSADGKRRKKPRSRDDEAAAESQDRVPETQEGAQSPSEQVNTREPQAGSFLRTRNASRPGAIYDDVAEDTPESPSAARLETRDARSREGSVARDEMELDASAAQENQDENVERTGLPQYNGPQNSQDEDVEMMARQAWNEHVINAQNNSNAQSSAEQYDEIQVPTSAQRPQAAHDVYDVPGSPVQTPNLPSTSTKKSRSAKAKKAKPTFYEKSPSPEQNEIESPSTTTAATQKRVKKASVSRKSGTTRAPLSRSMQGADDGGKRKSSRMDNCTRGRFTDEELGRIARAVEAYRSANNMEQYKLNEMIHAPGGTTASEEHADLWTRLFATCPDRHRQKVINITRKKFHNFVARGTWTTEQDEELRDMIEIHGTKWSKIAGLINRHPEDLRDRYRNYIICGDSQRKDTWDEDEEVRLTQHVMDMMAYIDEMRLQHPDDIEKQKPYMDLIDWQLISERMGRTRSRLQCITKWRAMNINTHGKDKLMSKAPDASISFRLEKARRQIAAMPDEERYRMIMAIQSSSAQSESKIPWQRLVDKNFRASWHRPTQILLWRRLKQTVPGFQGKSLRDCASYLVDLYNQTGELPDVQDALYDDAEEMEFMSTIPMNHLPHGNASNNGQNISAEFVNEADEEEDEHQVGEYGISDENIQPDLPIAPMEHLEPAPMASMDSVTPVADLAPMDPAEMVDPALSAQPVEAVETTPLQEEPASIEEEEPQIAKPVDTPEFVEPAPPKATRVARRTGMGKVKAPKTPRKSSARSTPARVASSRRNTRRAAALSQDPIEDDVEAQLSVPIDDNSEVDEAKTRRRKTPSRFRSTTTAELPTAADDSDSVMDDMEDMPARIV